MSQKKDCFGFYRHVVTNIVVLPGELGPEEIEIQDDIDYYQDSEFDEDDDYDWYLHPVGGYEEPEDIDYIMENEIPSAAEKAQIISRGKNLIDSLSLFSGSFTNEPENFSDKLTKFNVFNDVFEMDHNFKNKQLLNMVGEQFKQQVINAMQQGKFSMNLSQFVDEDKFLKREIEKIIKPTLDQTIPIKRALGLQDQNIKLIIDIFLAGFTKFKNMDFELGNLPINTKNISDQEMKKLLEFNDQKAIMRYALLRKLKIVYIPSGGGKTTLTSKYPKLFYDVDQLVKDNLTLYKKLEKIIKTHPRKQKLLRTLFFKYTLYHLEPEKLTGKILLMNHPNQVPNCFKYRKNELILLPFKLNWRIRFFAENFYSLLFSHGYVKRFLEYDQYKNVIFDFFKIKKFKFKDQVDNTTPLYQPSTPN